MVSDRTISKNNNSNNKLYHRNKVPMEVSSSLRRKPAVPPMLLLLLLAAAARIVDATITVLEPSRKAFASVLNEHLGQPLLGGYDYMGRLQYLDDNLQLCPDKRNPDRMFDIVVPQDGHQGAYRIPIQTSSVQLLVFPFNSSMRF